MDDEDVEMAVDDGGKLTVYDEDVKVAVLVVR